jgi:metallo-beta-lactamase family protein
LPHDEEGRPEPSDEIFTKAFMMHDGFQLLHHGAVDGVTGSCHELRLAEGPGILIDCGLFQGAEESIGGARANRLEIEFPVEHIRALVVTHVHLDHVGRIPYLMAAGFHGPIYCSEPSAVLLPLVLEDAVKVGLTRDQCLLDRFLKRLRTLIAPLPYGQWQEVDTATVARLSIKMRPAGHILGSACVECRLDRISVPGGRLRKARAQRAELDHAQHEVRLLFSGDLGAPYTPLLPAPRPSWRADVVVLESTYGDRLHEKRHERRRYLQQVIERSLIDRGVVLVPAFSIGRTQELLYELEGIIHCNRRRCAAADLPWEDMEVIVDSPLANRFTEVYRRLRPFWDREARRRLRAGRHPLSFEQLTTIDSHQDHEHAVAYLRRHARPCVVIAAGGMCGGGRIVNYLKALLGDERTDVLLVGYQARGTPGRDIQRYGPRGGYVMLDGHKFTIRARVHTLPGYSAHADQHNLVDFIRRMRYPPREVRLVHGDQDARQALRDQLAAVLGESCRILLPHGAG